MNMSKFLENWKARAHQLKVDVYALFIAYRDPRTPWYARLFTACVVGYAFSPIDLIPDFIPLLGYLDDLLIVPLGIVIALKMIPPEVMAESRLKSQKMMEQSGPTNWVAAIVIILIWLLVAVLIVAWLVRFFKK